MIGLACTICGSIVLFHNFRSKKNQIFFLYCLSCAIWGYFYFAWQLSENSGTALVLVKSLTMGAIWIPVLHYHLITILVNKEKSPTQWPLNFFYLLTLVLTISNFSSLFIQGVEQKLFFPFWPIPGPFFHLYVAHFITLLVLAIRDFRHHALKVQIRNKREINLITTATLIAYGSGFLNILLWYDIPVPPYLNPLIPLFFVLLTWIYLDSQYLTVNTALKRFSLILMIYLSLLALSIPPILFFVYSTLDPLSRSSLIIIVASGGLIGVILSMGPFIYARLIRKNFWLKAQSTTGLTHELRSPLSNIQGLTAILKENILNNKKNPTLTLDYLEMIENNTARLNNFVRDLLDSAKINYQEINLNKSIFDLKILITELIETYRIPILKSPLRLQWIPPAFDCSTFADREKIRQILSNLLSNSIKFSNEGTINVRVKKENGSILCSISDEGVGIKKDDLKFVFDRFYQGQNHKTGAGLGLSIAKGWVEAHHGKIWTEPKKIGTTISFSLPSR